MFSEIWYSGIASLHDAPTRSEIGCLRLSEEEEKDAHEAEIRMKRVQLECDLFHIMSYESSIVTGFVVTDPPDSRKDFVWYHDSVSHNCDTPLRSVSHNCDTHLHSVSHNCDTPMPSEIECSNNITNNDNMNKTDDLFISRAKVEWSHNNDDKQEETKMKYPIEYQQQQQQQEFSMSPVELLAERERTIVYNVQHCNNTMRPSDQKSDVQCHTTRLSDHGSDIQHNAIAMRPSDQKSDVQHCNKTMLISPLVPTTPPISPVNGCGEKQMEEEEVEEEVENANDDGQSSSVSASSCCDTYGYSASRGARAYDPERSSTNTATTMTSENLVTSMVTVNDHHTVCRKTTLPKSTPCTQQSSTTTTTTLSSIPVMLLQAQQQRQRQRQLSIGSKKQRTKRRLCDITDFDEDDEYQDDDDYYQNDENDDDDDDGHGGYRGKQERRKMRRLELQMNKNCGLKHVWIPSEDEHLKRIVSLLRENETTPGGKKFTWKSVSEEFEKETGIKRTTKQCSGRYTTYLNPNCVNEMTWTTQEDCAVVCMWTLFESRWRIFAKSAILKRHNQFGIKSRWHAHLKRRIQEGDFSYTREDAQSWIETHCPDVFSLLYDIGRYNPS